MLQEEEDIDPVYNISQADIYQMVSYAVGSGISEIGLIYPSLPSESGLSELPVYEVFDEFTDGTIIKIHPFKVDIIHENKLQLEVSGKLEDLFETASIRLCVQLNQAIEKLKSY